MSKTTTTTIYKKKHKIKATSINEGMTSDTLKTLNLRKIKMSDINGLKYILLYDLCEIRPNL